MHRLVFVAPILLLSAALASCSGSTSVTTPADDVRITQRDPGGDPNPPPPPPPRGCPTHYNVRITAPNPNPDRPPNVFPGGLDIDRCPPEGAEGDGFLALHAHGHTFGVPAELIEEECAEIWRGRRVINRGDRENGAHIVIHLTARLNPCSTAPVEQVAGKLVRVRTRWFTDRNGERHERTDTTELNYQGQAGERPEPPGGGDG